jgi:hypothetical protein
MMPLGSAVSPHPEMVGFAGDGFLRSSSCLNRKSPILHTIVLKAAVLYDL